MADLRSIARVHIIRELFGNEWRPDRPHEIGGLLGTLMNGGWVTQENGFAVGARLAGEIHGRLEALKAIDDAVAEMNDVQPEKR